MLMFISPRTADGTAFSTWANVVTSVRTVSSVVVAIYALFAGSLVIALVAEAIYMIGDVLDGELARRRNEETVYGAVFDITTDRICFGVCAFALLPHIEAWAAFLTLLAIYTFIDMPLSLTFLKHDVISVNYFEQVDKPIYQWNWSRPAKAVTVFPTFLLALLHAPKWIIWCCVIYVAIVKVLSLWRSRGIPPGLPSAVA